jgi:hypothetical protein
MSYCCRASCLRHHREMYFDLKTREWVHTDGWPCEVVSDAKGNG